ncbi:conserved hypothetical protein [Theileria orientalis strain Shintoku]|uniref:Calcium-transporting ATPase n=1 Tax=Theileria orientalis strain Shintoku TaxID=869250 RepID=J4CCY6_THEOR|nr:conserved hypothetical protein [Theileria orientalis strain Shintoku]PVC51630.1 hypothetical protein MACL_00001477 [Theileria orientalis]BAM40207.1 conserved hypothetical protein [Theileria orientalis strain Shintoku]|eukprot:XP_009690508.1 conserved hypothetical protein [Theileria orientalis strain Shintoku]
MDLNEEALINEPFQEDLYKYVQESNECNLENEVRDVKYIRPTIKIGLTTKEANQRIILKLSEVLNKCEKKITPKLIFLELQKADFILTILGVLTLLGERIYTCYMSVNANISGVGCFIYSSLTSYNETITDVWEYVLELLVLIPWILLNIYIKILIKINNINRKSNRIREVLEFIYFNRNVNTYEAEHKNYNLDPPSSDFISVYRNYQWVRLPRNVIAKGDVFKLSLNQEFPCESKLILNCKNDELIMNEEVYKEGDKCTFIGDNTDHEAFIDGTFLAVSDSFSTYLEYYVENFNNEPAHESWKAKNHDFNNYYGFKSKEANRREVIWNYNDNYIFLNNNNKILINRVVIMINTARLIILLDFVGLDPLYKLSELWGNVKLLSIFEKYHEHKFMKGLDSIRSVSSSSFLSNSSYDSESSDLLAKEITYLYQFRQIRRVLRKGLFDDYSLVKHLSCVTLLSFIDDIGILLNSNQSLQEISIITKRSTSISLDTVKKEEEEKGGEEKEKEGANQKTNDYEPIDHFDSAAGTTNPFRFDTNLYDDFKDMYAGSDPDKEGEGEEDDLLILDVYNDPNLYGKDNIRFTTDHEKNCRNQLKPLIFSMSLTALPSYMLYGRKGLYRNYISTLINSELDNFNNCLCTLTNVLGIKKLYLKRYKLLKFVLFNYGQKTSEESDSVRQSSPRAGRHRKARDEDERLEDEDSKILLYFYRDTNKKIIQMLIKCRMAVINNYKLNYYNGSKIINLNKRIKRKIKDLNIQWLSNGMNTFLYFYKPISINDFNIFLLLLPYITVYNISATKLRDKHKEQPNRSKLSGPKRNEKFMFMYKNNPLYYKYKGVSIRQLARKETHRLTKENVGKDVMLGSFLGKMLNSYIKNSILLGMVGTKHSLPKELSNRINDLHEAGIRFVYFSKHNEKITRIVGGLLGLETSWNSMISLSTSETTSFINQEGHTVLPNGIDNIRQHIQQVDDIPLQVSLYCNCNFSNIGEMLDILNENGERIMCVGSGLNPNNFYLFNNSHISFSISLNYNPICKFCKGKRWQGISKAHIFEEPKPEFKLSSLITSLTSSLQTSQLYKVSDPEFIFDMLYEMFKEARRMSTNLQESISFMLLSYYSLIWMYFLQNLLSLPPVLSTFDFVLIVFVYIPFLSLTLISNPAMDKIMEHLPNKVIQTGRTTFNHYVRTYLRLLVISVFVVFVYYIHMYYSNLYINDKYLLNNQYCRHFFYYPRYRCFEPLIDFLSKEKGYDKYVCIVLSQQFTSISFVVFLVVSSLSWIHKYSYINLDTFKNIKWIVAVVKITTVQIAVVAIRLLLLSLGDTKMMKMMIVNTSYSLLLVIPILLVDEFVKFFIIKNKNTQQKFLKLLFSTRLGTWSPK